MDQVDRARLADLLPKLLQLLAAIAEARIAGESLDEFQADYRYLHGGVRELLTRANFDCVCPWPNLYGWAGTAAKSEDWQALLAERAAPAKLLAGLEKAPPWALTDYFRRGHRDDTPFWSEFADRLEKAKQTILLTSLNRELAYRGTSIKDPTKLHKMSCSDAPGFRTSVQMYKIRQGEGQGEVALRVFFVTDDGFRLVLLHGYDKGSDLDPARELREAEVACERRLDFYSQDPVRRRA